MAFDGINQLRMPELIMFDLDGTLVDTVITTAEVFSELRVERGYDKVCVETIKPYISRGAEELVVAAMGPALNCPSGDLKLFRSKLGEARAHEDQVYTNVLDVLEQLRSRHVTLAVVTNKPQYLAEKLLEELDLDRYFALVVGGDSVPNKKPHRDHINTVLDFFDVSAGQSLLIGDSEVDQNAARASGVEFVLFKQGYAGAELLACKETINFEHYVHFFDALSYLYEAKALSA
jgi:phosphoglycolate phosphatase